MVYYYKTNKINDSEFMIPSFISLKNFSKHFPMLNIIETSRKVKTRSKLSEVILKAY